MASNSAPDIMNVKEIIEFAFGDFEKNTVNFKLVQTVLLLIARQLRLLERRVIVEVGPLTVIPSETLTVTEVKVHAKQKTKTKPGTAVATGADEVKQDVAKSDGKPGAGADTIAASKRKKTGKTATGKTTSSTEKSSSDKTSTDKTTTSAEKSSTDKTSTDKTTTSAEKSSTDKTSTDKTTTSAEKSSTDKTSTDKTTSSTEKSSADKSSSAKPTSTSADKSSSAKTTSSSTDKPLSSKTTSSDRRSVSRTPSSSKYVAAGQKPINPDILNTLEEQRERELRIIHQRTDSFEETTKTPTPMASVSSLQYEKLLVVEKVSSSEARLGGVHGSRRTPQISVVTLEQFNQMADTVRQLEEKFLPIGTPGFPENIQLMEELRKGASLTDAMAALQLSARLEATEKTLGCLIAMVTELALQTPGVELDSETRALLGISATWERDTGTSDGESEGERGRRAKGSKKGISATRERDTGTSDGTEIFKAEDEDESEGEGEREGERGRRAKGSKKGKTKSTPSTETAFAMSETAETEMTQAEPTTDDTQKSADTKQPLYRFITYPDLESESRDMYDEMIKKVKAITLRTTTIAETANKLSMKLEARLDSALVDASRMDDLENAVRQYAEQINALDTGLSSQMTNYQEQLTQMQHDLEIGLDTMAEVFGNSGGDNEAVAELHSNFTNLQTDLEIMSFRQKELKVVQNSIAYDLENLWREIEMLRDTKSDREEVADALRDKAGICELNGLVSLNQFEAVRSDFQKRISAAYDKFNNQESIWQKAIDDMVKVLNEKADLIQVYSLKDEIHKYLTRIQDRMQIIADIVGEPKSAMLSKKVFRDTSCLSCGSPANMDVEEPSKVPALPKFPSGRQPAEGAEAESQTKGGGDYGICYPDLPIKHPRDPRSHICKRYCGGSHTVVTDGLSRTLPGLHVQPATRPINAAPGTDGKLYLMDEQPKKIPCLACNMPKPVQAQVENKICTCESIYSFQEVENKICTCESIYSFPK